MAYFLSGQLSGEVLKHRTGSLIQSDAFFNSYWSLTFPAHVDPTCLELALGTYVRFGQTMQAHARQHGSHKNHDWLPPD